MSTAISAATNDVRQSVEGGAVEQFLERLAEKVGARASVAAVFGEPVVREGLTVIPVARVRWGVGGGAGVAGDAASASPSGSGSGSGGGGGVAADPVGYLVIGPAGVSFQAISAPYPSPLFVLAGSIGLAVVLRALARLIRG